MWDIGSTLTFITFVKAKAMKLKGRPVKLGIVVVGGKAELVDSQIYQMTLLKQNGKLVDVEAYGIEKISSQIDKVNIGEIATMLNVAAAEICRPVDGEIDILIGQQYAALHPERFK